MIYRIGILLVYIFFISCKNNGIEKNGLIEYRNSENKIEKIEFYYNGINDGISANFHKNGRLYSFGIYKKDSLKNGPMMIFYENGQINIYDNYVNNKKEGVSLHYNSNGILTRKTYFNNGLKDGYEYIFDFNSGDTISVEYFRKGRLYHPDGADL